MFDIDSQTGEVYLSSSENCWLNVTQSHRLKIIATDAGKKNSTIDVNVFVFLAEISNPTFNQTSYRFHVPGNAQVGFIVGSVRVVDRHGSPLRHVVYGLESGNEYFEIDKNGTIILVHPLRDVDRRKRDTYSEEILLERYHLITLEQNLREIERAKHQLQTVDLVVTAEWNFQQRWKMKASVRILIDWACPGCDMVMYNNIWTTKSYIYMAVSSCILILLITFAAFVIVICFRTQKKKETMCHP